jgi:hypothetical protein
MTSDEAWELAKTLENSEKIEKEKLGGSFLSLKKKLKGKTSQLKLEERERSKSLGTVEAKKLN